MNKELEKLISESNNIVFFGGAGVSCESGIPDFRSEDGLYSHKYKFPPEIMLSHTFFKTHTIEFFDFYKEKMIYLNANPNNAHKKLSTLEKEGKLKAIITQNIDGLHQKAGSRNVLELHGSVLRNFCLKCNKFYEIQYILNETGIPYCSCGGIIKPDVVLYEEPLNNNIFEEAILNIRNADMLIIGGTSLAVYPAANLINYYVGNKLVLINKDITPLDKKADFVFRGNIGEILSSKF